MKKSLFSVFFYFLLIMAFLSFAAAEAAPPSLTDFMQLYGKVEGTPAGTYTLTAKLGTQTFTTKIQSNGTFGYASTFKIYGSAQKNGQEIIFFIGTTKFLSTMSYENKAVKELLLQYPGAVGEDNGAKGGEAGACVMDWQCGDWGACKSDGYHARECIDAKKCNPDKLTKTEEETCASSGAGGLPDAQTSGGGDVRVCVYDWQCTDWSVCKNNEQARTCERADNCEEEKAQGIWDTIIIYPKPAEVHACGGTIKSPPAKQQVMQKPPKKAAPEIQLPAQLAEEEKESVFKKALPWIITFGIIAIGTTIIFIVIFKRRMKRQEQAAQQYYYRRW